MIRNEKGQFVSENKNLPDEEKKNVEVVDYDAEIKAVEAKLEELKKAQVAKIEEEKKAAALARKTEANVVNGAIDRYEEAKVVCNRKIKEAYEEYKAKVSDAEKELSVPKEAYLAALKEFTEKHGSFHYTISGDNFDAIFDALAVDTTGFNLFDLFF